MARPQKAREASSRLTRARSPRAPCTLQKCAKSERTPRHPFGTEASLATVLPSARREGRYPAAGRLGAAAESRFASTSCSALDARLLWMPQPREDLRHVLQRHGVLDGRGHRVLDAV